MHSRTADPADSQRAHGRIVARTRLLGTLQNAVGKRCITLLSPAGYGKTTTLGLWRERLLAQGIPVASLSLSPEDDELWQGLARLLQSIATVDKAAVREASLLCGRSRDQDSIERIIISLVRGIASCHRQLVLFIDDMQNWQNADLWHAVQLLLEYAPQRLLCVLSSRTTLPISLARLRAQKQVMELGVADLRFDSTESMELVRALAGSVDDQEALRLHRATDGWAAGLRLLCIEHSVEGVANGRSQPLQTPLAFMQYAEREVLSRFSLEELLCLTCASVPERFSAGVCAAMLNRPDALADSALLFGHLERDNIFVEITEGPAPETWWRMHPLLRDVLMMRFRALPDTQQQRLHESAWHAFSERGMTHDAVRHAVRARNASMAADLVETCADDLFARGKLQQLINLICQLPPDTLKQRPALQVWFAWQQLLERQLEECLSTIERLQQHLVCPDEPTHFRLSLLRGLHAIQCDNIKLAVLAASELVEVPDDADGITLAGRNTILTWIHLQRGEFEDARQLQLRALQPMVAGQLLYGTTFGTLAGRCLRGLSHAVEGRMIQAERIYRDVLHEAETHGSACVDAACLAAGLLGETLYELQDLDAVLTLLEHRIDVMEQVCMPDTVLRVMLAMSRARLLLGRPAEGFDFLQRLAEYASRFGLDRLLAYSLLEQLQWLGRTHGATAAMACMTQLENLDERCAAAGTGTQNDIDMVAERGRIVMCIHLEQWGDVVERINALIEVCKRRGRQRRIAALHVQAAVAERRRQQPMQSRQHLMQALTLGHRLGLLRSLLDAHDDAALLIREVLEENNLNPVLAFYAERLQAGAASLTIRQQPLLQPQVASSAAEMDPRSLLSERETDIVRLLMDAMPNKRIARALELSPETVKWHLKNIYAKLKVTSRDEAVARIRALNA